MLEKAFDDLDMDTIGKEPPDTKLTPALADEVNHAPQAVEIRYVRGSNHILTFINIAIIVLVCGIVIFQKGKPGPIGPQGKMGLQGRAGQNGKDGKDGKDGKPGENGKDGTDGEKGKDGLNGRDGKDGRNGDAYTDRAPEIYNAVKYGVVRLNVQNGHGTGFFINNNTIITAAHLFHQSNTTWVKAYNAATHKEYKVVNFKWNAETDVAVIWTEPVKDKNWTAIPIGKNIPQVGSRCLAFGYPIKLPLTLSEGMVSAIEVKNPIVHKTPVYHLDIMLNPGNSGGPVVDLNGRLIGMTSMLTDANGQAVIIPSRTCWYVSQYYEGQDPKKLQAILTSTK